MLPPPNVGPTLPTDTADPSGLWCDEVCGVERCGEAGREGDEMPVGKGCECECECEEEECECECGKGGKDEE